MIPGTGADRGFEKRGRGRGQCWRRRARERVERAIDLSEWRIAAPRHPSAVSRRHLARPRRHGLSRARCGGSCGSADWVHSSSGERAAAARASCARAERLTAPSRHNLSRMTAQLHTERRAAARGPLDDDVGIEEQRHDRMPGTGCITPAPVNVTPVLWSCFDPEVRDISRLVIPAEAGIHPRPWIPATPV